MSVKHCDDPLIYGSNYIRNENIGRTAQVKRFENKEGRCRDGLDMCRGGVVDMYWTKDTEDGAAGQEEKEEGGCSEGRTRRGFV